VASRWIGSVLASVTGVTLAAASAALAGPVLLERMDTFEPAGLPVADPSSVAQGPDGTIFVTDASRWKGEPSPEHNLWQIDRATRSVVRAYGLRFTREPAGVAYHPGRDTIFITDDDELALLEVDRNGRKLREIDLGDLGARDPEGVAIDVEGDRLFIADGRGRQILVVSTSGRLLHSLSLEQAGMRNAEGIAYDPRTRRLFAVDGKGGTLFELDEEGVLLGAYDLAALGIVAPEGIGLVADDAARSAIHGPRLLIADELVHEQADGRIVEVALLRRPDESRVLTSLVGDADGFGFRGGEPGFAAVDRDHNGRLEPGEQVPGHALSTSGPADHREAEDDRATDALLIVASGAPLTLSHRVALESTAPLWARLTLVVADARALPLQRSWVRADGVLLGEVVGARGQRLAPGAVVQTSIELPPAALEQLRDGRLVVEIERPPGSGSDELWLDYSRLEVAVAR
jgi:hypothetical protein